jgi:hypothetical protein
LEDGKGSMMQRTRVHLLMVGLVVATLSGPAAAQENLDRGKSPQQIFNTDCGICHRTPRGLGAGMGSRELAGFLTEHYTTSKGAAAALAGYLFAARRGEPEPRPQQQRRRTRPTTPARSEKQKSSSETKSGSEKKSTSEKKSSSEKKNSSEKQKSN